MEQDDSPRKGYVKKKIIDDSTGEVKFRNRNGQRDQIGME
jgi:hypothetical protein